MTALAIADCGTTAGYHRHIRNGEEACQSCRDAWAAYHRKYRTQPEQQRKALARNAARTRALNRLAKEYPDRFRELVAEETRAGDEPAVEGS
jgi:hypothetical protein